MEKMQELQQARGGNEVQVSVGSIGHNVSMQGGNVSAAELCSEVAAAQSNADGGESNAVAIRAV